LTSVQGHRVGVGLGHRYFLSVSNGNFDWPAGSDELAGFVEDVEGTSPLSVRISGRITLNRSRSSGSDEAAAVAAGRRALGRAATAGAGGVALFGAFSGVAAPSASALARGMIGVGAAAVGIGRGAVADAVDADGAARETGGGIVARAAAVGDCGDSATEEARGNWIAT
jgi:hypothetical protein